MTCIINKNHKIPHNLRIKVNGKFLDICDKCDNTIREKLNFTEHKINNKIIPRENYIIDIPSIYHNINSDFGQFMKGHNKNYPK